MQNDIPNWWVRWLFCRNLTTLSLLENQLTSAPLDFYPYISRLNPLSKPKPHFYKNIDFVAYTVSAEPTQYIDRWVEQYFCRSSTIMSYGTSAEPPSAWLFWTKWLRSLPMAVHIWIYILKYRARIPYLRFIVSYVAFTESTSIVFLFLVQTVLLQNLQELATSRQEVEILNPWPLTSHL